MKSLHSKQFKTLLLAALSVSFGALAQQTTSFPSSAQQPQQVQSVPSFRIGFVNTNKCVEQSKLGKQEQISFDKMKQQMETVLRDKGLLLEEIKSKLEDEDYMDSISDEAASELKRKKRAITAEGAQLQNQYAETLQQARMKVMQKLTEVIAKASQQVAQDPFSGPVLDAIFTDEACTYFSSALDVTDKVVAKMDAIFDAEKRENSTKGR